MKSTLNCIGPENLNWSVYTCFNNTLKYVVFDTGWNEQFLLNMLKFTTSYFDNQILVNFKQILWFKQRNKFNCKIEYKCHKLTMSKKTSIYNYMK